LERCLFLQPSAASLRLSLDCASADEVRAAEVVGVVVERWRVLEPVGVHLARHPRFAGKDVLRVVPAVADR